MYTVLFASPRLMLPSLLGPSMRCNSTLSAPTAANMYIRSPLRKNSDAHIPSLVQSIIAHPQHYRLTPFPLQLSPGLSLTPALRGHVPGHGGGVPLSPLPHGLAHNLAARELRHLVDEGHAAGQPLVPGHAGREPVAHVAGGYLAAGGFLEDDVGSGPLLSVPVFFFFLMLMWCFCWDLFVLDGTFLGGGNRNGKRGKGGRGGVGLQGYAYDGGVGDVLVF